MNIEQAIGEAIKLEVAKAADEEIERAQERLRDRIAEIVTRIPLKIMRDNDMRTNKASFTIELNELALRQQP